MPGSASPLAGRSRPEERATAVALVTGGRFQPAAAFNVIRPNLLGVGKRCVSNPAAADAGHKYLPGRMGLPHPTANQASHPGRPLIIISLGP